MKIKILKPFEIHAHVMGGLYTVPFREGDVGKIKSLDSIRKWAHGYFKNNPQDEGVKFEIIEDE